MKTYKNLYPKLCSKKNLMLAFKRARKNKTAKYYVTKIEVLKNGATFLGYRIYGKYKLLKKSDIKKFQRKIDDTLIKNITNNQLLKSLTGWFGYAKWANTHKLRKDITKRTTLFFKNY